LHFWSLHGLVVVLLQRSLAKISTVCSRCEFQFRVSGLRWLNFQRDKSYGSSSYWGKCQWTTPSLVKPPRFKRRISNQNSWLSASGWQARNEERRPDAAIGLQCLGMYLTQILILVRGYDSRRQRIPPRKSDIMPLMSSPGRVAIRRHNLCDTKTRHLSAEANCRCWDPKFKIRKETLAN